LTQGEEALRISLGVKDEIVKEVKGSFYLAQMLAREVCLQAGVLDARESAMTLLVSFPGVRSKVWDRLGLAFRERCERFCRGSKLRREGRAPYLHILNWLASSSEWTLPLREAIRNHAALRGSVGQVVEKNYLRDLIAADAEIQDVLHLMNGPSRSRSKTLSFCFTFGT
jgi:hypothetical protein